VVVSQYDKVFDAGDTGDPAWEVPDLGVPADPHDSSGGDLPQGAAFAEGGWADALAPDPVLATLVQREGPGKLDDDRLTGVLQAANRLAAWCAAQKLTAESPAEKNAGARAPEAKDETEAEPEEAKA